MRDSGGAYKYIYIYILVGSEALGLVVVSSDVRVAQLSYAHFFSLYLMFFLLVGSSEVLRFFTGLCLFFV